MIISKRNFENAIYEAVQKREQEMWKERRYEEDYSCIMRNLHELESRVSALEGKAHLTSTDEVRTTCNLSRPKV